MDIVLATRNKKKAEEMKKILEDVMGESFSLFTLDDFPACPDIEEDGKTFEENATKKALSISNYTGMFVIADDSGLEVEALNGAPGVLSARYAGEPTDDKKNIEKLLKEMEKVSDKRRAARFVCCIAFATPNGDIKTFHGYIEGMIGIEPRGRGGFGYDPVFYPNGYDMTFAEMSEEEKNAISHRGQALRALQKYLLNR